MHVYLVNLDTSVKKVQETTLCSHVCHITTARPVRLLQPSFHVPQGRIIRALELFENQNVFLVQKVMPVLVV